MVGPEDGAFDGVLGGGAVGAGFTLKQLGYFVTVAERGSLRAAAQGIPLSESALSAALTELEQAVGAQLLLRRRSQGAQLTVAGREFAIGARRLLRSADGLGLSVSSADRIVGRIVIGAQSGVAPVVVPRLVRAVSEAHPELAIEIRAAPIEELLRWFDQGEIDMICAGQLPTEGFDHVELLRLDVHVLLSADHPLAAESSLDVARLADEPYVLLDSSPSRENSLAIFAAAGVTPTIRFRVDRLDLVRSLVGQRLGFSLQIVPPAGGFAPDGSRVVAIPLDSSVARPFPVSLARSTRFGRGPQTDAVFAIAAQEFASNPEFLTSGRRPG